MQDNHPLEQLMHLPLEAIVNAQEDLELNGLALIEALGFEKGKLRTMPMTVGSKIIEPPILGLVPAPSLGITSAEVDLQVKVESTAYSDDQQHGTCQITARPAGQKHTTRKTDHSPALNFKLKVAKSETPEGYARLVDALLERMAPHKSTQQS